MNRNFLKKIFIKGSIETLAGLHIGSSNEKYTLGILDHAIVRDPITHYPIIPGSSLKGKLRVLMEEFFASSDDKSENNTIDILFGTESNSAYKVPGRLIFRDAVLSEESIKANLPFADLPQAEIKKECYVNRETGKAKPCLIERVPAGFYFNFEIILNLFDGDDEKSLVESIFTALNLLQDDYLGARGTRGYGAVKIHLNSLTSKDKTSYGAGEAKADEYQISIPDSLK